MGGTIYSFLVCYWSCAITLLDQKGGNGLIVFCYMLPTVAALSLLRPIESILAFGSSCVFLNILLVTQPEGMYNLFSNLVNSIVITLLSIFISVSTYRRKITAQYDQIVIRQQYEKIADMNRRLNQMVVTDELTQMYNRRYLEEVVQKKLEEPGQGPIAGLMIDIDYFKQYNDHYGHLAGDDCLQKISGILMRFAEMENYFIVRYGGEEFFFCLLQTSRAAVETLAENLRAAVEKADFSRGDVEEKHVTISIGVSMMPETGRSGLMEELIRNADAALYQAKTHGRNRVVFEESSQDMA